MDFDIEKFKTQGIKVNYYYICKRKLWLFDKGISLESTSDRVMQGKVLHENSYEREKNKEVLIDNIIRLDIINDEYVKEVKISSKMQQADKMQILYYLLLLKEKGIIRKGSLNYTKEKRVEVIELTDRDELILQKTLIDINEILAQQYPPKFEKLPYCKKCSYYEFCFVKEVE